MDPVIIFPVPPAEYVTAIIKMMENSTSKSKPGYQTLPRRMYGMLVMNRLSILVPDVPISRRDIY